ncbi:MAG: flavodoxin reductase [Planctomycetota bacterium]
MSKPPAVDPSEPTTGTDDWQKYAKHRGRVLHREQLADRVHLYIVEKPDGFDFRPGQAVSLAIDEEGWREEKRPFTMTSLPSNPRLEFIVKSYPTDEFPDHDGMTEQLGREVEVGDRVLFGDAWGAIEYRGPGVFLAGGAGITPFVAILRQLEQDKQLAGNRLFFSNSKKKDVFLQGELFRLLGPSVVCTLTDEKHTDYEAGIIDRDWLESRVDRFDQPFYLCGPPAMVEELSETLSELGVSDANLVKEES